MENQIPWVPAENSFTYLIPEMHLVENKLYEAIGRGEGTIYEMCRYLLKSGGKRLRPLLVLLCGKALKPEVGEDLITAGTAAELIHMASLVHDDIIDEALYRRGCPALNSLWGKKHAVLAGDFLFAKAFDLMVAEELYPVLNLMVTAIEEMCQGEIDQQNQLFQIELKETDYFTRINKKTGSLLAACCASGAIIGGGDYATKTALRNFGTNLGFTFQIVDDILDFTGQSEVMGKPVGQDLVQGNLTLPILYLLKHPQHGNKAKQLIEEKKLSSSAIQSLITLMVQTDLFDDIYSLARSFAQTAKEDLTELPRGIYRDILEQIVDKALVRKF